jgi:hypothetical protein
MNDMDREAHVRTGAPPPRIANDLFIGTDVVSGGLAGIQWQDALGDSEQCVENIVAVVAARTGVLYFRWMSSGQL